jgi:hypothetical protein
MTCRFDTFDSTAVEEVVEDNRRPWKAVVQQAGRPSYNKPVVKNEPAEAIAPAGSHQKVVAARR